MRQESLLDGRATGDHQCRPEAKAVQGRTPRPDVAKREAQHGKAGAIDAQAVTPERDVIAEPGRHYGRVRYTPDPSQRDHVVQALTLVRT